MRGFKPVAKQHIKHSTGIIIMPMRKTRLSAGYDFHSREDIDILPNDWYTFWTDIKAYMMEDEVLEIYIRSSKAINDDLRLVNQTGIIDADYFENIKNDGNIGVCIKNVGSTVISIADGDAIAQGKFAKYLITDDDAPGGERKGGIGSTTKE